MVETPKLSSLAGELLKFFMVSSLIFGGIIAFVFFFLGGLNPYYSVGAGLLIALTWVLFNILWMKGKLEELFGRLLYIVDLLEERHKETTVVPIPIHEEVMGIVTSIKNMIANFEEKYQKELRELEEQMDLISDNSSKIIEALEKVHDGYMKVDFPSGLDPVGAIGQALEQTFEFYRERFSNIKKYLAECHKRVTSLALLFEEDGDKIDIDEAKRLLDEISELEEEIEKELRYLKDV